jgi:hypothetical protein
MTAEEIVEMMMSTTVHDAHVTKEEIADLLARRLAAIAGKLSREELYGMIAIGSLLYQIEDTDIVDPQLGITEDLLIKTLKVGGNA